jgi:hypothetical protein
MKGLRKYLLPLITHFFPICINRRNKKKHGITLGKDR